MKINKRGEGVTTAFSWFFGIIALIGVVIVVSFVGKEMLSKWGSLGGEISVAQNPLVIPYWNGLGPILENSTNFLFASDSSLTWQLLFIMLLIFTILAFSFVDIFTAFTSFQKGTARVIGISLALLASVTGVVKGIAIWFGLTAGLGAVGIGIVLINSIVVFVAINLFMGKSALIAMHEKKAMGDIAAEASATKTAYAAARKTVKAINEGNTTGARN